MNFLKKISIRTKLKLVILSTCTVSVVLVFAGFFAYEQITYREILANDLATKADIIAENSNAALAFRDSSDAAKVLQSLASQPEIIAAAVYNREGTLFATFVREGGHETFPPSPEGEGWKFEDNALVLYKPIKLNAAEIGTIYLTMDLVTLNERYWSYLQIALLVLAGSLIVAYIVATALERNISDPILSLVETAQRVSLQQDFSIRAVKTTEDETGSLADSLNHMLAQIQERDADLRRTNEAMAAEITERKKAETEIEILNATLEQKVIERTVALEAANKELEAFSYSVSHDLRAPLRHIDGFAQLLQRTMADPINEKAQRYIDTISQSAKRLGQLIDELLIFSRMGRTEKKNTVVSMGQLVRETLEELRHELDERKVQVTIDPLPSVKGDPAMLRLVWMNLLSNAVKYTRNQESPLVQVGATKEPEGDVFFVRDNGAGFNMKYADKLFGVFQRLHRSDEFEGTGIGLANVKRIVVRHSGRVWAEGAVNKGATFFFTIPKFGGNHG